MCTFDVRTSLSTSFHETHASLSFRAEREILWVVDIVKTSPFGRYDNELMKWSTNGTLKNDISSHCEEQSDVAILSFIIGEKDFSRSLP
jgi:hypothetical protein